VVASAYTYVEMCSAVAAAMRAGRFRPGRRDTLFAAVDDAWAEVGAIPVDEGVLRSAATLAEAAALRAGDALQLATLLSVGLKEIRFACWDLALREAARQRGFFLVPTELPSEQPLYR
jgi:predicted nucleic acid-binding protein